MSSDYETTTNSSMADRTVPSLYDTSTSTAETPSSPGRGGGGAAGSYLFPRSHPHHSSNKHSGSNSSYGSHSLAAAAKAASAQQQQHYRTAGSWTSAPVRTKYPYRSSSGMTHQQNIVSQQPVQEQQERPVVTYPDNDNYDVSNYRSYRRHDGDETMEHGVDNHERPMYAQSEPGGYVTTGGISSHHHYPRNRHKLAYANHHHHHLVATAAAAATTTTDDPRMALQSFSRAAAAAKRHAAEEKKDDVYDRTNVAYPDPEPDLADHLDPSDLNTNDAGLLPAFEARGRSDKRVLEGQDGHRRPQTRSNSRTREIAKRFEQQQQASQQQQQASQQQQQASQQQASQQQQQQQQRYRPPTPGALYGKVVERHSKMEQTGTALEQKETGVQSKTSQDAAAKERSSQHQQHLDASYMERSEIETPEPAKVKDLKQKLWGPNDCLQVAVKPNWSPDMMKQHQLQFMEMAQRGRPLERHDVLKANETHEKRNEPMGSMIEERDGMKKQVEETRNMDKSHATTEVEGSVSQNHHYMTEIKRETRPLDRTDVPEVPQADEDSPRSRHRKAIVRRNARSLSPSAKRPQHPSSVESSNDSHGKGGSRGVKEDSKGDNKLLFKSKFYEAAQRGLSTSPARSSSTAATRSNASSYQRKREASAQAAMSDVGADKAAIEALVARLSSVDRSDPSAALAKIDAILRGDDSPASRALANAVGVKELETVEDIIKQGHEEEDDADETSSDDSSVSSITNPTFHALQTTSNKAVAPSGGKPRPSTLVSYGNLKTKKFPKENEKEVKNAKEVKTAKEVKPTKEEKKKRKSKDRGPPPGTICLSNKEKNKNGKTASPDRSKTSHSSPVTDMPTEVDGLHINASNSAELAEKIRRWDELSSPDAPAVHSKESNDLESVQEVGLGDGTTEKQQVSSPYRSTALDATPASPNSLLARTRKPHPWDSSIPVRMGKVNTRDTSMDSALGIEAEFTPKYDVDEYVASMNDARQLRKERLVREMHDGEQTKHSDEGIASSESAGGLAGDGFEVDPKRLAAERLDTTQGSSSMQRESAEALAEDFDSAWVSLPTSTFFPDNTEETQQRVSRSSHPSKGQVDSSEKLVVPRVARHHDDLQMFAPKTENGNRPKRTFRRPANSERRHLSAYDQGLVGASSSRGDPSAEVGGVEIALTPQCKPSRRRFRGLLRRRGNVARETVVLEQASSLSSAYDAQTIKSIDEVDLEERGRRRRNSSGSNRGRARSLDDRRTRNPSIARKFSRLLRVYDTENDERGHI